MPHGDWHFLGQEDPPLDETGVEQARQLGERLAAVSFARVWSSDLVRAVQTAALAAQVPLSAVKTDKAFREVNLGSWEGLDLATVRETHPNEYAAREKNVAGYRFPGGESFREMQQRVLAGFSIILDEELAGITPGGPDNPGQPTNLMVVAHKNANRSLLCHYMAWPLEKMFAIPQEYCCLNLLRARRAQDGSIAITVEEPRLSDFNLSR
jgi:probable phosphoglycerate mutase